MRDFERLDNLFFGVPMFTGRIDIRTDRYCFFYFIVEHTDDLEFIQKQVLQLLVAGCDNVSFYGKAANLWCQEARSTIKMVYPDWGPNYKAMFKVSDDLDGFINELFSQKHTRSIVPADVYLVYDDESIYRAVLKKLETLDIQFYEKLQHEKETAD